jgi:hypothetical protein
MAAPRCPHCEVALTEAEAAAGLCPDCASPFAGGAVPEAVPVLPTATAVRGGRLAFPAGLIAGAVIALSAAAAWWAWGPGLHPVGAAGAPPSDDGGSAVAEERANRVQAAARTALEAVAVAEERRAAAEDGLADAEAQAEVAEERVAALQQAAAEAEAKARSASSLAADTRDMEERAQKARAAAQQAEVQRAAAERALAEARLRVQGTQAQQASLDRQLAAAQGRLQTAKGKEDQARQAEGEAVRARQTAERQLADARTRLQAAQTQADALDKALVDRKAKLADRDRAIEAKKAELVSLDRAVAAKRAKTLPRPDMDATAGPKAAGSFVREWLVIGPFADPDRKGHATAFPPEGEAVDLAKDYKGVGSLLRWRPHTSSTDYVDLAALFKIQDPAVGYAVCWVRSDRVRAAQLSLGSNDGIKVWVNGKQVADRPVSRSAAPGQDHAACELAAGWNELRVKVDNTGGPWGFYLELQEPDGKSPLSGLELRVKPLDPKTKK